VDVQRSAFVEGDAGVAFITGFAAGVRGFAIDGLRQNAGTGGLSYPPGAAKQESMC